MSVTDIRHGESVSPEVAQGAAEIKDALRDLPLEAQAVVQDRLFEVAAQYQATGQVDPLIHYVQSLLMTARLHRNPAYRKSLAEADAAAENGPPADVIDVAAYMQSVRERRAQ